MEMLLRQNGEMLGRIKQMEVAQKEILGRNKQVEAAQKGMQKDLALLRLRSDGAQVSMHCRARTSSQSEP